MPKKAEVNRFETASRAERIVLERGEGYYKPTKKQQVHLAVGFARVGKVLIGAGYDLIKMEGKTGEEIARILDSEELTGQHIRKKEILIIEVKSSSKEEAGPGRRKRIDSFSGHFTDLTAAQLLTAQNIDDQYRFVLVRVGNGDFKEFSAEEFFARIRKFYPKWAVTLS